MEGVFRTAAPVAVAVDQTPCHELLRFQTDSLVLHASLCGDVEARWSDFVEGFNRDASASGNEAGLGVGAYVIGDG